MSLIVPCIVGVANEQNSIANKVCADDWIAERAIIASTLTDQKDLHEDGFTWNLSSLSLSNLANLISRKLWLKELKLVLSHDKAHFTVNGVLSFWFTGRIQLKVRPDCYVNSPSF